MNTYEEKPILPSQMAERYAELCALRDSVNAEIAPIQAQLDEANARAEQARVQAAELAAQIDSLWGREKWVALKKEIGVLAKALSGKSR